MCNHYRNIPGAQKFLQSWREYISWSIDAKSPPEADALDEDVWPRREAAVVRQNAEAGGAFVDIMTWGVPLSLPGKRPGTKVSKHITNVRNLSSPFWRSMLAKPEQRCLVPFTTFAEPKIGAGREEHWFTVKDREVAAFAGVWRWAAIPDRSPRAETRGLEGQPDLPGVSTSLDPNGKALIAASPQGLFANLEDAAQSKADERSPVKVFAFLTCEPNPLVAPLHPRAMPVILAEADYSAWLTADWEEAVKLVTPFPSQLMAVS